MAARADRAVPEAPVVPEARADPVEGDPATVRVRGEDLPTAAEAAAPEFESVR